MNPSPLYLKQLEIGPMENFVYLVGDRFQKECYVVDPAWDVDAVLSAAAQEDMKIVGGLLTHTHYDHVNGAESLMEKTGGKIFVHKHEADFLKGMKNHVEKTEEGSRIVLGRIQIRCIHTPGHTPGSQCFLAEIPGVKEEPGYLFSGDTLFRDACGRCDLPGSSPEAMYESLQRLAKLDERVIVLPGHDYGEEPTSTIGREKMHNPYYQCRTLHEFLHGRMG